MLKIGTSDFSKVLIILCRIDIVFFRIKKAEFQSQTLSVQPNTGLKLCRINISVFSEIEKNILQV